MGVFENKNYNYSLTEIKDENERKAVRKSKMEAVKEFFKVDTITELGTGSSGRTIVYQVNHYAVKLICGVTQKCNGENLNSKMTELDCLIAENLNINKNFCREMINMTILSSITDNTAGKLNIIPEYYEKWACKFPTTAPSEQIPSTGNCMESREIMV